MGPGVLEPKAVGRATAPSASARRAVAWRRVALAAPALLLLLALPLVLEGQDLPYPLHVLILVAVYATLAQAWNILGGYAGQVSLGNAVFFGLGAYATALPTIRMGLSPWLGMLLGIALAVLVALLIGFYTFRLAGHYYAIATIAVVEIVQTLFINSRGMGGASGLSLPILPSAFVNLQFTSKVPYYYLALALVSVGLLMTWLVERSRLGYYFRAVKDDPLAARSLGVNVFKYKLIAIMLSAGLTAICGAFYTQYILFIDPDSVLSLTLSVLIVLVAVLGGVGTIWGPLLGALILIPLSEGTRVYLAQAGGGGRAVDLMIYGLLIVLISIFQPGGLVALLRMLGRQRRVGSRAST